jgi:hypothetical protein
MTKIFFHGTVCFGLSQHENLSGSWKQCFSTGHHDCWNPEGRETFHHFLSLAILLTYLVEEECLRITVQDAIYSRYG